MLLFVATSVICSGPSGVFAQSANTNDIAKLNTEMVVAVQAGKYDDALAAATKQLEIAKRVNGPQSAQSAVAYANIGTIYRYMKRFKEAIAHLESALAIREAISSNGSDKLGLLSTLAYCKYQAEDYKGAEADYRKALDIFSRTSGKGRLDLQLGLANSQARIKDFSSANSNFLEALRLSFAEFRPGSPERENVLINHICLVRRFPKTDSYREAFSQEYRRLSKDEGEDGEFVNGKAISLPAPTYPAQARARGAAGTVYVRVVIDAEGKVRDATVVCSDQYLGGAATEAARRAKFTPTLVNGKPTETTGLITYNFVSGR